MSTLGRSVAPLTAPPAPVRLPPAGAETELLLRGHVMPLPLPLPRPGGDASLCLSASPTTPTGPPAVESGQKVLLLGCGGELLRKGVEGGFEVRPLQMAADWGGVRLKKQWGRSGVEEIFVLFLSF